MPRSHLLRRIATFLPIAGLLLAILAPAAHAADAPVKPVAARPAAKPAAAAPRAAAASGAEGWRTGPSPAWIVPAEAALKASPTNAGASPGGIRGLLFDRQVQIAPDGQVQEYIHTRTLVTENVGLQEAGKSELSFNPAFQTLVVHEAAVWRDGVRTDRLAGARMELLRREQGLESEMLTGVRSLLVVMNDVRVGDVVEVAWTVVGHNPIFRNHFAENFEVASSIAIDSYHLRIANASGHPLRAKGIRTDLLPEITNDHGVQLLVLKRRDVPAIVGESNVPAWFKVWPSVHVSDYADWNDVARWAVDLFADPGELGPELEARVDALKAKGLSKQDQVATALTMVQEEVRYFSLSLGENSHRPKAPGKTWKDRNGDCKDKSALLVAILRRLGFDAEPALVSHYRNRGVADYLPGHDQFDHVITRLQLDDQTWWLDGTLTHQGRQLATRGYHSYGTVLVVAPQSTGLVTVQHPASSVDTTDFDQRWDVSDLRKPVRLTLTMTVRGTSAEFWRVLIESGGLKHFSEALTGTYARFVPGLKAVGEPRIEDDLDTDTLKLTLASEVPTVGQYERGVLVFDVPSLNILDWMTSPQEATRQFPWGFDNTRHATQHVHVVGPRPVVQRPSSPIEIGDKHFLFAGRMDVAGNEATLSWRYDRRADELLPAYLSSYRERIRQARNATSQRVLLPLVDFAADKPMVLAAVRSVQDRIGQTDDQLTDLLLHAEADRIYATEALRRTGEQTPFGGLVLVQRVQLDDHLADFGSTLIDADKALKVLPDNGDVHYARGLALLSQDRAVDAIDALGKARSASNPSLSQRVLGVAQYYAGRYGDAVQTLTDAVSQGVGDDREYAMLWLYLAAERQTRGRGRDAIAPYVDSLDPDRWPTALVRHLNGQVGVEDLMSAARKDSKMARLNDVEAQFWLGQRALAAGDKATAKSFFQRTTATGATPYIEHLLAGVELKRMDAGR